MAQKRSPHGAVWQLAATVPGRRAARGALCWGWASQHSSASASGAQRRAPEQGKEAGPGCSAGEPVSPLCWCLRGGRPRQAASYAQFPLRREEPAAWHQGQVHVRRGAAPTKALFELVPREMLPDGGLELAASPSFLQTTCGGGAGRGRRQEGKAHPKPPRGPSGHRLPCGLITCDSQSPGARVGSRRRLLRPGLCMPTPHHYAPHPSADHIWVRILASRWPSGVYRPRAGWGWGGGGGAKEGDSGHDAEGPGRSPMIPSSWLPKVHRTATSTRQT